MGLCFISKKNNKERSMQGYRMWGGGGGGGGGVGYNGHCVVKVLNYFFCTTASEMQSFFCVFFIVKYI